MKQSILLLLSISSSFLINTYAHASDIKRGEYLFNKNCLICHGEGPSYIGTKVLASRYQGREAILLERKNLTPAFIEAITRNGMGVMPGFRKTEINEQDMHELIEYMMNK